MSSSSDIQSKYLGEFPIGSLLLMPLKGTMTFTQKINDFIDKPKVHFEKPE